MIPINGIERFYEIRRHYEAGEPMEFAGGHYVIVSMEFDTHTEGGWFVVQQVRLIGDPTKGSPVRDAATSHRVAQDVLKAVRDWAEETHELESYGSVRSDNGSRLMALLAGREGC